MPYLYSEEQSQIRDEVRRTLEGTVAPAKLRSLLEAEGKYDDAFWKTAREMGWTAIGVAEEDGGLGLSLIEALIVAEETGRVIAGAPFLATAFAVTDALKHGANLSLLKAIASGEKIAALALTEGSEPIGRAVLLSPEHTITGEKTAVLGAACADIALVSCTDSGGNAQIAIVDLEESGVVRQAFPTVDNSRCLASIHFDGARATLLPLTDATLIAEQCLGRLALHLAAESVGGTDACIALASNYANQRQAFGQAIGKFQAVKHAIAEMYVANELARASILDAAVRLERGDADVQSFIAAARLNAVHAYEYSAAAATQVHGGIGVTWEADLHLHYRRSRSLAAEAGAPWYWEDRIAIALEAA
ncbi:MAG: acyl-CoA dehydrogenase family protein [Pseudomonadota bacterium]